MEKWMMMMIAGNILFNACACTFATCGQPTGESHDHFNRCVSLATLTLLILHGSYTDGLTDWRAGCARSGSGAHNRIGLSTAIGAACTFLSRARLPSSDLLTYLVAMIVAMIWRRARRGRISDNDCNVGRSKSMESFSQNNTITYCHTVLTMTSAVMLQCWA